MPSKHPAITTSRQRLPFLGSLLLAALFGAPRLAAQNSPAIDFNRDIRPILSENCFYCHGQDANKRQADLRLDQRQAAIEGHAIAPGDLGSSQLVDRIDSSDPETLMPPPKSNRRLSDSQKELLKRWISEGAHYSTHWAFETPRSPSIPSPNSWAREPLDAFIAQGHHANGLAPSEPIDRRTMIKRVYADLVGLPPEPDEVERFANDPDPLAYERRVDELLADPAYGERMSLSWLDAARYADSNGFQQDGDTWQWMWRDWVVRALNENMPFDQFTLWQLAGDLLPEASIEQKIASGFNRNHLLNGEGGAIAEEQRFVILFDRIDTTATTWLGLTMACAQCHDHKYDPITMRDYYSLMDAFNQVPESGVPQYFSSRIRVAPPLLELPTEENQKRIAEFEDRIGALQKEAQPLIDAAYNGWRLSVTASTAGLPEAIAGVLAKAEGERSDEDKKNLEPSLRKHFDEKVLGNLTSKLQPLAAQQAVRNELNAYRADQIPRPMVMSDAQARKTHILDRGEYLKPREEVAFETPGFLPKLAEGAPRNRLGLAQWLIAPEHPLTSRVAVNRIWQHFFGVGLVKTAEDFGVQSEYPVYGPLLDYLAVEYQRQGWDTKRFQRSVLLSSTYRQSSRCAPEDRAKDPENKWFARATRFRMPAMVLRDWALACSGMLVDRVGGVPVYPYQPEGIWDSLAITKERDFSYPKSSGAGLYRKSLYTFWRRTVGPANMFDASNRQACRVRATQTSTPLHALTTLNDPTWVEAARNLAQLAMQETRDSQEQLQIIARRVLARNLAENELEVMLKAVSKQRELFRLDRDAAIALLATGESKPSAAMDPIELAALSNVCLTIMNLDEALSRE
ncbi:MAG: PSD1 and planctomycete cytochrome C domain-containing protein [Pirellula sp.]